MKYIDCHSHWADLRFPQTDEGLAFVMERSYQRGIDFFLQGGVSPDEWQRQLALKSRYPDNIGLCFGLHPYFVSEQDAEDCERALDELAQLLPQAMALGETGLDFRPHIVKESEGLQIEMFENQISLAKTFQKPLVLHVVRAHEKALQILDIWGVPERRGFLHAFNGSYETAKKFIDQGFYISVGGAVTYPQNRKLRQCLEQMPLEFLLLESDSPDQPPQGRKGMNEPDSIYQVAEEIGLIRNISPIEVLEQNTVNFKRLFRL